MDIGNKARPISLNDFSDASGFADIHLGDAEPHELASSDEEASYSHDQLPHVEEYKISQGLGGGSTIRPRATLAVSLIIVVASLVIVIGVLKGNTGGEIDRNEPEPTVLSPTSRVYDVIKLVGNMGWSDRGSLQTPGSAQWKAAQWISDDDPKKMELTPTQELMNRYILATLYFALGGEEWYMQMNFLSNADSCKWHDPLSSESGIPTTVGVSCYNGESVREIFLPAMNLKGSLPSELGLMLDLYDINLFRNKIEGVIPDELKNLRRLKSLVLHDNEIKGTLPEWLTSFSHLANLNLSVNKLAGLLPSKIGEMPSLETLALEKNFLSGSLHALKGSSKLRSLYLGGNAFLQGLGDELLSSWTSIEVLDLSDNLLDGELPTLLLTKDKLVVVDLHGNSFTGELPVNVQVDGSIEFLALQHNQLSGPIEDHLSSLSKLKHLDLSKNAFTGDMPTVLGQLKELRYLFLAFNEKLNPGPIPAEYATLPNLVDLSLQTTKRNGEIPYQFESLSELVLLDLNDNELEGAIPTQLGGLASLKFLLLKNNKLTGSIPSTFKNLQLDTLLLDFNDITAGTENVCAPHLPKLTSFIADCDDDLQGCSCCTKCCKADDLNCNDIVWYSDVDPIAEGGYVRDSYLFLEADLELPVSKQDQEEAGSYYKNYTGYTSLDTLDDLTP